MITIWQIASVPFWLCAVYFVGDALKEVTKRDGPSCVPCALIAAGCFAYVAARIAQ